MPDTKADDQPIEIPPLTGLYAEPFSPGKLLRMMQFFGPAAVVASLGLGVGETIMVTGLGAWSEYDLFWLLILSGLWGLYYMLYYYEYNDMPETWNTGTRALEHGLLWIAIGVESLAERRIGNRRNIN